MQIRKKKLKVGKKKEAREKTKNGYILANTYDRDEKTNFRVVCAGS